MTIYGQLDLVGVGLYTWIEAARLVRVRPLELRRWLKGYSFSVSKREERRMPPLWESGLAAADVEGISFQDLLEVRVVRALRELGVSLQHIREARLEASVLFHTPHPFSTRRILTDGRTIFAKTMPTSGEEQVLNIVKRQFAFKRVLEPSLSGVEFDESARAVRWFPLPRRPVMLDPTVAFGKPVVTQGYVRTDILSDAVEVEGSKQRVARLYEVPVGAVEAAMDFEHRLAA